MTKEFQQAIEEYHQAEQAFLWAESNFIDTAVLRLEAAKQRINSLVKEAKQCHA
jgi:hypothetical protein